MYAKRIIPCLDVNCGRVVKGVNFVNLIDAGDPVFLKAVVDQVPDHFLREGRGSHNAQSFSALLGPCIVENSLLVEKAY